MARTLQQLKESIENLINQQGADAPVAAFIYTQDDVVTYDDNCDEQSVPLEIAEQVLANLENDYDYLYTEIFNCIESELRDFEVIAE